jgi:type II secretory pathway pseudopilin PulG
MERLITPGRRGERGFTLAALIVILAIMMIFIAYSVPKQWSTILQRERDYQTIFIMRQYARAILLFQQQHGGAMPTSVQQLRDARNPRVLRWKDDPIDPLTGQTDWLVIPAASVPVNRGTTPPPGPPPTQTGGKDANGNPTTPTIQGFPMKDYAGGPFVAIKSPKTGKSYVVLNGADQYEQWLFTSNDLQNEIQLRQQANGVVLGGPAR